MWDTGAVNNSLTQPLFHPLSSDCELGEWSQWSSCMKKNKTCGFKKGSQSRVRVPLLQVHSPDTSPAFVPSQTCTPQTEKRKCVVTKTPCVRGKHKKCKKKHMYYEMTASSKLKLTKVKFRWQNSDYNWISSQVPLLHEMTSWYDDWWIHYSTSKDLHSCPRVWPAACWLGLVWLRS